MPEFKLLIDRLTDRPQRFEYEADPDWWADHAGREASGDDPAVDRPFRFVLSASRLGEDVLIDGVMTGSLAAECSRCTRRYAHALRDTFRLVLKPIKEDEWGESRAHEAIDPEGARALAENGVCLGDDLEAGWFRGPVIFLDALFAEVIATAMPIQPLCDEDCPGLCPHCGMERRRGEEDETAAVCGCEDERVDSPFAVLAGWKGGVQTGAGAMAPGGRARTKPRAGSGKNGNERS
jgi:uncharacterized metal-binding protein YceD (DUF177 family)